MCTSSWMQGPSPCAFPGAGDWLPPASPRPLPSSSSWLCRSRAPQKSRQGDFCYCHRNQTSHFTKEERRLRRTRPWPWWAGHPWDSVGPHPGWTLKDGGKTGTQSTSPQRPCESRQEEETLRRPWGRGGGEAGRPEHRESPRAVQSPGSREGGACKGGGLPDKIQKTQLNLNFKQ